MRNLPGMVDILLWHLSPLPLVFLGALFLLCFFISSFVQRVNPLFYFILYHSYFWAPLA